jgi:hypothetical protein
VSHGSCHVLDFLFCVPAFGESWEKVVQTALSCANLYCCSESCVCMLYLHDLFHSDMQIALCI